MIDLPVHKKVQQLHQKTTAFASQLWGRLNSSNRGQRPDSSAKYNILKKRLAGLTIGWIWIHFFHRLHNFRPNAAVDADGTFHSGRENTSWPSSNGIHWAT
jgi:hypothetical protein